MYHWLYEGKKSACSFSFFFSLISCICCLLILYSNIYFSLSFITSSYGFCLNQDSPDAVRLIVVAISIFGSRKITQEIMCINSGREQFLQSFNEVIIPWCLKKYSASTAARLDLLLALLDDECFSEQWDAIITYLLNQEKIGFNPGTIDRSHITILAILMEKVREGTRKSVHRSDSFHKNWQHELLDLVAVAVVRASPPFGNSDARFLWYAK